MTIELKSEELAAAVPELVSRLSEIERELGVAEAEASDCRTLAAAGAGSLSALQKSSAEAAALGEVKSTLATQLSDLQDAIKVARDNEAHATLIAQGRAICGAGTDSWDAYQSAYQTALREYSRLAQAVVENEKRHMELNLELEKLPDVAGVLRELEASGVDTAGLRRVTLGGFQFPWSRGGDVAEFAGSAQRELEALLARVRLIGGGK